MNEYILARDHHAIVRLNHQHFIMKELYGHLIHPSIPLDKEELKIAVIGTGSCIWPADLARHISPRACIDAIDITLEQCPPQSWLLKNINLIVHDVFKPFPSEMLGKYDIVHAQLLICVIKGNNPREVIGNLMSLLKPNGFLQWNDLNVDATRVFPNTDTDFLLKTAATEEMIRFIMKPRESSNFNWASQLGLQFANMGLSDVVFDRHYIAEDYRLAWNMNCVMLFEEFSARLEEDTTSEDNPAIAAQLRDVVIRASRELRDGAAISSELVVAVGRKA